MTRQSEVLYSSVVKGSSLIRKRSQSQLVGGAALLFLLTSVTYIPALSCGFIWDDDAYVAGASALRTLHGLYRIWFEIGATPQYYPLVHTSFWLEYHIWALSPFGYHLVNVILHSANVILVWLVLRRLSLPLPWWIAAVFALHPVHVESVAWITERKNVLSGCFYLLSVLAFLRFSRINQGPTMRGAGKRRQPIPPAAGFYWLSLGLFLCALLSKTVTASLPAVLLLIAWWKQERVERRLIFSLAPFFAAGAALGLTTTWLERHLVGAQGAEWAFSFVDRCLIAGRALWFYAGKLIWPHRLAFIYPQWEINSGVWWQYLFPALAVGTAITLWLVRSRIGKGPLVAILFFAGTLFPALGFFNVYPMRYSFVADHFQYLASLGVIALAVAGIEELARRFSLIQQKLFLPAGVLLLVALGSLSWNQAKIYKDLNTLWQDTIAKNPRGWMAYNNLGGAFLDQAETDKAILYLEHALSLKPDSEVSHLSLGKAFAARGQFSQAIQHYAEAIRIKPDYAEAHYNLGNAYLRTGRAPKAVASYSQALQYRPNLAEAYCNLGNALYSQGKFSEAIAAYTSALRLKSGYAEAHNNLGAILYMQGSVPEAISHYREALRINPGFADSHYNLGVALLKLGREPEAAGHFSATLQINPNHVGAREQLARLSRR